MKIKRICFIVPHYPYKQDVMYTFVREVIHRIAETGIECSVIVPQSITHIIVGKIHKRKYKWIDNTSNGSQIKVFQPLYVSLGNLKISSFHISPMLKHKAVIRCFKKEKLSPTLLYAHFWHSGVTAGCIGNKWNIPTFVISGESEIWVNKLFSDKMIAKSLKSINGVICVSTKNYNESLELKLSKPENMIVIPNSINSNHFYRIDKNKARSELGFPKDSFIVMFTGAFSNRKGINRLIEAVGNDPKIKLVLVGSGSFKPEANNILFQGKLQHNLLVKYLNAADVFALPTLAEGCCNAIIEAMACGLPIISSNKDFNDDILNSNNSIRINSESTIELKNAIEYIYSNPDKCAEMGNSSLESAKELELDKRVTRILNFIGERI